jgi:hypothetical protein
MFDFSGNILVMSGIFHTLPYNASVENFSFVEKFSTDAHFNEAGDMLTA